MNDAQDPGTGDLFGAPPKVDRFLHLSDLHNTEFGTMGGCVQYDGQGVNLFQVDLRTAVHAALARGPFTGVIVTGDAYDRARPTPNEHRFLGLLFQAMAMACAARKVLVIAGNHELPRNPGEASAFAGVDFAPFVQVVDRPGIVEYAGRRFACLPYPRRAALRESDVKTPDPNQTLAMVLRALGLGMVGADPDALLFHGDVEGAKSSLQPRGLQGDIPLGIDVIDAYPAAMLGHIHLPQPIGRNGYMAGSTHVINFGEEGEAKGGVIWEAAPGQVLKPHPFATTLRQWSTIEADPETPAEETAAMIHDAVAQAALTRAVVRIRGTLPESHVVALRTFFRQARRAGSIVLDGLQVLREHRMRDASVGEKMTDEVVLRAALQARGIMGERQDRLLLLHDDVRQGGVQEVA